VVDSQKMVALLAILALSWAAQQAVASSMPLVIVTYYNSSDCTGAVLYSAPSPFSEAFGVCYPGYGSPAIINGQEVLIGAASIDCPAGVFGYGLGGTCDTKVPLNQVCVVFNINPPITAKASCLPDICKPESRVPKATCDRRVAQCNAWGLNMKWWVAWGLFDVFRSLTSLKGRAGVPA
jgi:hypothetical protein